jgi:hypothetical protein
MTRAQKIASFKISLCMALIESLRRKEKPKGAVWNKLLNLEEHMGRVLDVYRIEKFHKTDLDKAVVIFDSTEAKIDELYPKEAA